MDRDEWVYGAYLSKHKMICIEETKPNSTEYRDYFVVPESVSEFTGLTDKNGKKIFEGDIVKVEEFISTVNGLYRVIYDEINHCYALERNAEFHHSYFSFSALNGFHNTSCVIGNIHDNPELLGGGQE